MESFTIENQFLFLHRTGIRYNRICQYRLSAYVGDIFEVETRTHIAYCLIGLL